MKILEELNDQQSSAVFSKKNKICVIAGPGCGKTRTLVARVIHLISSKEFEPESILLLTFSKKAIKEIKERIVDSIGSRYSFYLNIHNFHSFCYRFLRENYSYLGFDQDNFPIYDRNDQESLLKRILFDADYSYDGKELSGLISIFSLCKIKNGYSDYLKKNDIIRYEIFEKYQENLKINKALDFNDLLIYTIKILKENNELRKKYQDKFTNILVDEFQDVNDVQWEIVNLLSGVNANIFIVGDPNQSIYGFQGSSPNLISSFINKDDWSVVYLSINYRSTKNIISASNSFLINNEGSLILNKLESVKGNGAIVEIINNASIRFIVKKIVYLIENQKVNPSEIVILYRNNYLSSIIEQELVWNNIPYEILGAFKFIEREEVKDVLSYLKTIIFHDNISFLRILKITEGIGPKFIENLENFSQISNLTILDYLKNNYIDILNNNLDWKVNKNQKESISKIIPLFDKFKEMLEDKFNLSFFINKVIEDFNYFDHLDKKVNSNERKRNIQQFLNIVKNWERANCSFEKVKYALNDFIQYCLMSFEDNSMKSSKNNLFLSSVHQAKGLEFNFVFFVYLDKNILPYKNSIDLDEEKRIFYVGITRAKRILYLVSNGLISSDFIKDIQLLNKEF
ncbi:MAG: ATP-dependent DNA helicase PcrA [Mycoplasmataceae bacterium]|nr:MAG: ATP-dependent DNA helicase PcrA [Mycoplasmataceae bacterium]